MNKKLLKILLPVSVVIFSSIALFIFIKSNDLPENDNINTMRIDDLNNERSKEWVFFTDRVMGGRSSGSLSIKEESGIKFYRMTGDVSTENNGGFIQFRTNLNRNSLIDKNFEGISLMVRGNNEDYNIHIRTGSTFLPWQYYSVTFFADENWTQIRLPFNTFERSNFYQAKTFKDSDIRTLGIVAYGKDYFADLDISLIEFY